MDNFHEWLYLRFRSDKTKDWTELSQEDKDFWLHESEAVRRAVERGGFKKDDR
jgi:hypothetical protein